MWIRVALDRDSLKTGDAGHIYIDGDNMEEYFFDDGIAALLDKDHFLTEMWDKFDAMFDWGDCDYFSGEKCKSFVDWLEERLGTNLHESVREVYNVMLEYAKKAIEHNTGMYFDF